MKIDMNMNKCIEESSASINSSMREIPVFNIANILTWARLLAVPIFIWCYYRCYFQHQTPSWLIVWLIFALSAVTDKLDGYFARKFNLVTPMGIFLDPIADKILICSACILLSLSGKLPVWFTVIVIAREIFITLLRIYLTPRKGVLSASAWGKHKTSVQVILIAVLLVPPLASYSLYQYMAIGLLVAATCITIFSALMYIMQWLLQSQI